MSTAPHILTYLAAAHRLNPDAEVSGPELQHELGLDAATVREGVAELARQGLVEWDPLLTNLWLRLTDKGLAESQRWLAAADGRG
jgi:DNA-binding IclR family transcriptional regulator